jgi:transposase
MKEVLIVYSTSPECPLCGVILELRTEYPMRGGIGKQWICPNCDYQEAYEPI